MLHSPTRSGFGLLSVMLVGALGAEAPAQERFTLALTGIRSSPGR